MDFTRENKTIVDINELAEKFFAVYHERLKAGMPQLLLPNRLTVMERIIGEHNARRIDRQTAIERVSQEAFNDVIPRFHTVNNQPIPEKFYKFSGNKLTITDSAFNVFSESDSENLNAELLSRWDLLEAAFLLRGVCRVS